MPIVRLGDEGRWTNYHGTGTCEGATRFALRSGDAVRGRDEIAIAAKSVQDWLKQAAAAKRRVRPLGAGWSPSNVNISSQSWLLHTRRFNRCFRIGAGDVRPGIDASALMLVEAGALVDEVSDKFEEQGRSLWTSGAGNGQTFAGACATGTHGSMIARGGIQDHIRAAQIVTPGGVYWIEPGAGVMSDAFIAGTGSAVLRDDALFAAAQLPVGSLGIVTALVVDSVPKFLVRPIQNLRKVDCAALDWLAVGNFRRFSAAYALDRDPDFVQMIVNPYKPFKRPAMLRFLYCEPWREDYPRATPGQLGAGYDALSLLGRLLNDYPWARGPLLQFAMKQGYASGPDVDAPTVYGSWGEGLDTHRPLADLFNASVTIDRSDLARAFERICAVYAKHGGSTVVTVRFMERAQGLLAPARFAHNAVIDFDGPRSQRTADAYARVVECLDVEGVGFTRHWAKSCRLDAARVAADYGNDFGRWRAARDRLMPDPAHRALFGSEVLDSLGLTC
ncbi:FAD/FMN-containing dehydrogenase [Sphingopyxis sp. YR583]|uniref:FAD-binding protein n=1 Tax=Sphingopyxis sp. YR583 TaxID=1881047 RepID=UPI0008A76EE9|nr:FAD-binding protein [Sphingopyxis sp. YR583]SEH11100.1 FAD/FMN-containing dehydrogenase [Sphingopyxis sp. YR583]